MVAIAAAAAALVAGMPMDAAAKKNRLRATVDGKRIKFTRNVSITAGGDTIAFLVIGQARLRYGGLLRTLGVSCADFPPATIPGQSLYYTANYQETRISRTPSTRLWALPVTGPLVTFDSYDGTQVEGTFSAVLPGRHGRSTDQRRGLGPRPHGVRPVASAEGGMS